MINPKLLVYANQVRLLKRIKLTGILSGILFSGCSSTPEEPTSALTGSVQQLTRVQADAYIRTIQNDPKMSPGDKKAFIDSINKNVSN